jgi:hypothetical protein
MVHLAEEILSELLDGGHAAGAEAHLATCRVCRDELEAMRRLRAQLRDLPPLDPPAELWPAIAARLPVGSPARRRRLGWPRLVVLQAAAAAALFVIGLGLGRMLAPTGPGGGDEGSLTSAETRPGATSLAAAMAEVRRLSAEYDAALQNLERLTQRQGGATPSLAEERLASLNTLVEASRAALSAEPTDPVLNTYLFTALEQRDQVLRELRGRATSGSEVLWR